MAYDQRSLDDYVDVATRIADFRAKHPHGSLRPLNEARPYSVETVEGTDKDGSPIRQTFIVSVARADDGEGRYGVGMAWEIFPGRTPYTRHSELMNAETSAWGRAIIALGASDSKAGIASREEVRNRQAERDQPASQGLSDTERQASGMMTTQQRREHTQIKNLDKPARPADRGTLPSAADPWAGQPPGDWQGPPEDKPGSSTREQHRALGIIYGKLGITERESRLTDMTDRVGRRISSARDLSYQEAAEAIVKLTELHQEGTG